MAFLQDISTGASGGVNAGTADGSNFEQAGATMQQEQPQEEQVSMDQTCASPVYDIGGEEDDEIDTEAPELQGGEALGGGKGENVYVASADSAASLEVISAMFRGSALAPPHGVKVRFVILIR